MTELINREELGLVHMGDMKKGEDRRGRVEVMGKYQGFIYRALRAALMSLTKKALLEN